MPPSPEADRWRAQVDSVAFSFFSFMDHAFQLLFIVGIVFGIGRFVFAGTLAIIQRAIRHRERYGSQYTPFVSVVVPAHNEEKIIVRTLTSLLNSDYPSFDVIVVDDGSRDHTASVVQEAFGQDSRVRLFVRENSGKSSALNFILSQSRSDIIIAVDADTLFDKTTMLW